MTYRSVARIESATLILGGLALLLFGWAAFGLNSYLPQVNPSQRGQGVTTLGAGPDGTWAWTVALSSLTMIAATGLPRRSLVDDRWTTRGSIRGAVLQGIGGLLAACGTLAVEQFSNGFYFVKADDRCTYPSCWPMHQQTAAMTAPGMLAGLSMIVMAFLVRRAPWWVRAVVPVVVWVVALVVQHVVWGTLLPVFEGPPR